MRPRLEVASEAGMPVVQVPAEFLWELVEYLSFQRVRVSYEYAATHFVVRFLRSTPEVAQELLDHWTASAPVEAVGA